MKGFTEFETVRKRQGRTADILRISIYETSVRYSKNLLKVLKNPEFVKFYFDKKNKKIAITAGSKKNFWISKSGTSCSKVLVQEILTYCYMKNPKFDGHYDEENQAVVFDLTDPVSSK